MYNYLRNSAETHAYPEAFQNFKKEATSNCGTNLNRQVSSTFSGHFFSFGLLGDQQVAEEA